MWAQSRTVCMADFQFPLPPDVGNDVFPKASAINHIVKSDMLLFVSFGFFLTYLGLSILGFHFTLFFGLLAISLFVLFLFLVAALGFIVYIFHLF